MNCIEFLTIGWERTQNRKSYRRLVEVLTLILSSFSQLKFKCGIFEMAYHLIVRDPGILLFHLFFLTPFMLAIVCVLKLERPVAKYGIVLVTIMTILMRRKGCRYFVSGNSFEILSPLQFWTFVMSSIL